MYYKVFAQLLFLVCVPISNDFAEGLGRCGPSWGNVRCNGYIKKDALYCDLQTGTCHDDEDLKVVTYNDAYDYAPKNDCQRKTTYFG